MPSSRRCSGSAGGHATAEQHVTLATALLHDPPAVTKLVPVLATASTPEPALTRSWCPGRSRLAAPDCRNRRSAASASTLVSTRAARCRPLRCRERRSAKRPLARAQATAGEAAAGIAKLCRVRQ